MLAIACGQATGALKKKLRDLWHGSIGYAEAAEDLAAAWDGLQVEPRAEQLFETYKTEAIRALDRLDNAGLKGLLRRVVGKIFDDVELEAWCDECEARYAASRAARSDAAG
jgi:hypothetical protein